MIANIKTTPKAMNNTEDKIIISNYDSEVFFSDI
jgi:hypothetical protein